MFMKHHLQKFFKITSTWLKWKNRNRFSFKVLTKDISPSMGKFIYFLGAVTHRRILPWWLATSGNSRSVSALPTCDFDQYLLLVTHFHTCWKTGNFISNNFSQSMCIMTSNWRLSSFWHLTWGKHHAWTWMIHSCQWL